MIKSLAPSRKGTCFPFRLPLVAKRRVPESGDSNNYCLMVITDSSCRRMLKGEASSEEKGVLINGRYWEDVKRI